MSRTGSPNIQPQELSPAMMRLPPSPDLSALAHGKMVPDFSLDDDTIMHRGNLSKKTVVAGHQQQAQQQQQAQPLHRLRSVAKYNAFHPQALACSNDILTTSYKDHLESSMDFGGPASLGAIAGPRGVALFRLSKPHIPLLIFSHATNYYHSSSVASSSSSTSGRKGSGSSNIRNSISSLAFQPTNSDKNRKNGVGGSTNNSNTLYLAAARGSGVLIWDASGHSPNPLLGRLINDNATNDTSFASGVGGRRDLETRITSMSWMPYCGSNTASRGGSNGPLLATTTASSLSMWDLRCHQSSGLFQPSLRFGSARNASLASGGSSAPAPLVQVACSSCSEECATMDVSGVVRTYDLRKTEGGGRYSSSVGYPLSVFVAHEAGVGIDHLARHHPNNGRVDSAWVTWGLESPTPSAIVKVWGTTTYNNNSYNDDTTTSAASEDPSGLDRDGDKDEYWFMGDESQKSPLIKGGTHGNTTITKKTNDPPTASSDYQLIAQYARPNICCARVCAFPVKNSFVVLGHLDDRNHGPVVSNEASSSSSPSSSWKSGGWWVELMSLAPDDDSQKATMIHRRLEDENGLSRRRGDFGLDRIVSFAGGAANTDIDKKSLTSVLGNADIGRLQAAELAFSSSIILRNNGNSNNTASMTTEDGSKKNEKEDEAGVELLLCCLSDTGILTTTAIPEAFPTTHGGEAQNRDSSPQKRLRANIIRTAFATSNNQARVFPETKEGSSLVDIASMWGATSRHGTDHLAVRRGDDNFIEQTGSSSPLKLAAASEDSLRKNGCRPEGGFMPFDMDVPVPVAYNSVTAGNLNAIQLGMTEMTPLSAIMSTPEDGIEGNVNSTSIIENIDMERIPCPRLCGAVFGFGNGRLTIFRNGEVKKMWNWYQRTDTIRLSSIPGGQVDVASSSDPQTLITDTKNSTEPGKRNEIVSSNSGPRTLKELVDMVSAAKEVSSRKQKGDRAWKINDLQGSLTTNFASTTLSGSMGRSKRWLWSRRCNERHGYLF